MAEFDYKKRKKISGKLTSGSTIIQKLFEGKDSPLSEQFIRWKIWYSWVNYVGPYLAQNCLPVGYDKGVLYIWVKNSSWMHHMLFLRDTLQEKINAQLGKYFIKKIQMTLDRKDVPAASDPEWQSFIDNIIKGGEEKDKV